jgi:hypothetical protein
MGGIRLKGGYKKKSGETRDLHLAHSFHQNPVKNYGSLVHSSIGIESGPGMCSSID